GNNNQAPGAVSMTTGTITGGTGVISGTSYAVQSGSVSAKLGGASATLTKTTTGTVTLTGANSYGGGTTVTDGPLAINSDASLGAIPASPTVNLTVMKSATPNTTFLR